VYQQFPSFGQIFGGCSSNSILARKLLAIVRFPELRGLSGKWEHSLELQSTWFFPVPSYLYQFALWRHQCCEKTEEEDSKFDRWKDRDQLGLLHFSKA
jgi:hypothetical protein